jgi:hypothetical protein
MKSRRMRWAGHVTQLGVKRNDYRILMGKREEERSLRRPTCRWVGNVKMVLKKIGWTRLIWLRTGTSGEGLL